MTSRLRIAVYDLYFSTMGGGEQVAGTVAEIFAREHDVTLLSPEPVDAALAMERLGVDVSACAHQRVIDDLDATAASADFDLFVNGTYLSRAVNHSPRGWYYVHFPQRPPDRRDRLTHQIGVVGNRLLSIPARLPERIAQVREGFDRRVQRDEFVSTYERFLANSRFTAQWVTRLWDVPAEVLSPPVRVDVHPVAEKQPLILNIGRFFDPRSGHCKKQLELVEAFGGGSFEGWRLALAGGCDGENRDYYLAARRAAQGHEIDVHVNAPGSLIQELLGAASIYWHAGGLGEDPKRHPERFEHFGIAVVEAMAAGAVPLVYAAAGPAEIVEHGVNGYHWNTIDELVRFTRQLVADPSLRQRLSASAQARASEYSVDRFGRSVAELLQRSEQRTQ